MNKYAEYIMNTLTARELLEQLAEECSELSKASLKLIRALELSENATPIDKSDRYIGHLAIYDDESVRCRGKYSDTEKDIRKAQEELDCFADNHSYKYQGQNTELPTYEYYRYGGGYFRV